MTASKRWKSLTAKERAWVYFWIKEWSEDERWESDFEDEAKDRLMLALSVLKNEARKQ